MAKMMDTSEIRPGDVVAWIPTGGKQTRRVLVDEITEDGWIKGIEVTSRYSPRVRRGVRSWPTPRLFLVWAGEEMDTARGGERITNLIAFVARMRTQREGA